MLLREVARTRTQANRYFVNTTMLRLLMIGIAVPLLGLFLLARQALLDPDLSADTVNAILLLFVGLVPATISAGLTALFQAYERHEMPAAIASISTLIQVTGHFPTMSPADSARSRGISSTPSSPKAKTEITGFGAVGSTTSVPGAEPGGGLRARVFLGFFFPMSFIRLSFSNLLEPILRNSGMVQIRVTL